MSKKLKANGLWESSRMMLPEHKEAINRGRKEDLKKIKPDLDEQKLDELSALIQESYNHQVSVQITVFDEYKEQIFVGVVTHLDPNLKYLKLKNGQGTFKINYTLITDVSYGD